ncbi:hypothetical protein B0H19DRAFT_1192964 [Mycena capillaripes]|nr:hypothetical protein B0H19DRAFT_1192964 [Mycena capillaripes]
MQPTYNIYGREPLVIKSRAAETRAWRADALASLWPRSIRLRHVALVVVLILIIVGWITAPGPGRKIMLGGRYGACVIILLPNCASTGVQHWCKARLHRWIAAR